jgi:hypothetical protein
MVTEVEIGGKNYRLETLTAKQQFHVSRKISPILPPLLPIIMAIGPERGKLLGDPDKLASLLQPFADGLAAMPNDAADFVFDTCLSVVKRQTDANVWMPVWNASAQMSTFEDLNNMGALLPIVMRVIKESLGPFTSVFLTKESPAPAAA